MIGFHSTFTWEGKSSHAVWLEHIWVTSVFRELSRWGRLIWEGETRHAVLSYCQGFLGKFLGQKKETDLHQGQCKQLGVGNLRKLNGPCNPALSSQWQMKWLCVSHLTSRLIFLIAEEGWHIIHHLANLSSSTTSWNTLLQIQVSGRQEKKTHQNPSYR